MIVFELAITILKTQSNFKQANVMAEIKSEEVQNKTKQTNVVI